MRTLHSFIGLVLSGCLAAVSACSSPGAPLDESDLDMQEEQGSSADSLRTFVEAHPEMLAGFTEDAAVSPLFAEAGDPTCPEGVEQATRQVKLEIDVDLSDGSVLDRPIGSFCVLKDVSSNTFTLGDCDRLGERQSETEGRVMLLGTGDGCYMCPTKSILCGWRSIKKSGYQVCDLNNQNCYCVAVNAGCC